MLYKSWITGRSTRSCRGRRGGERFGNDADKNEKIQIIRLSRLLTRAAHPV